MSNIALAWAMRQNVGHQPSKHVLLVLADYADENHSCFPSQEHIAAITEMSERSARECLRRLEGQTLIRRRQDEPMPGMHHRRTRYILAVPEHSSKVTNRSSVSPINRNDVPDTDGPNRQDLPVADASYRNVAPPLPEPDDRLTGTTFRESIRNPPEESIERDARARDARLDGLINKHPRPDQNDLWQAEDAWSVLSETERNAAVAGFDRWLERAGPARLKKGSVMPVSKYLAQRLWTRLPQEPNAPAPGSSVAVVGDARLEIKAFTRAWWYAFHWRLTKDPHQDRPPGIRVGMLVQMAQSGNPWSPLPDVHKGLIDELNGVRDAEFVRVSVDDRETIEAWSRYYWRHYRVRMPKPGVAPYVWMPAMRPEDLERPGGNGPAPSTTAADAGADSAPSGALSTRTEPLADAARRT